MAVLVGALVSACSGGSGHGPADSRPVDSTPVPPGACAATSGGNLTGVTITVSSDTCRFRVGEPARFEYQLVTTADVPPLHVPGGSGCSDCKARNADPATWVEYRIEGTSSNGNPMSYCLCDVGCCPPSEERTVSVDATTVSEVIDWSGRQWSGPSDTSNPMGDFFEPGNYTVTVGFYGGDTGQVVAALPITVEE